MSNAGWRRSLLLLLSAMFAWAAAACTQETPPTAGEPPAAALAGDIKLDGSSTVYPIAQAVAEAFMNAHGGVNVTVGFSGSANGIQAIIDGDADIANASRPMNESEVKGIRARGDDVVQMPIAYDGIVVVIHPDNDWATEMTVAELQSIWAKDSAVTVWSDIRPEWPDEPIALFAPGPASGTFEYFTEAINGEARSAREDVTASEDDNLLVQGVAGNKYAMGYFGFAYYERNHDKLRAVSIKADENAPAIAPSLETAGDAYAPLSRYIYMYPLKSAMARPEVQEFIKFYMSEEGSALARQVGYVPLDRETLDKNLEMLP